MPARIWLVQEVCPDTGELLADEIMQAEVGGAQANPELEWSFVRGNPIDEAEFNYLMALQEWAAEHAPDEPMANPRQPISWLKVPTPTF